MKSLDQFAQEGLSLNKENLQNVTGGIGDDTESLQTYYRDTLQPSSDCMMCTRGDRLGYPNDKKYECVYV